MSDQTSLDFFVSHDMNEAERAVWQVIRNHVGARDPIKCEALAELTGIGTRAVQRAIHALIHEHGKPIGSRMAEPFGYYHATTAAEREEVAKLHRDRAIAMLTTASKIVGVTRREYVARHQTEIEAA